MASHGFKAVRNGLRKSIVWLNVLPPPPPVCGLKGGCEPFWWLGQPNVSPTQTRVRYGPSLLPKKKIHLDPLAEDRLTHNLHRQDPPSTAVCAPGVKDGTAAGGSKATREEELAAPHEVARPHGVRAASVLFEGTIVCVGLKGNERKATDFEGPLFSGKEIGVFGDMYLQCL